MNVDQYRTARDLAGALGSSRWSAQLEAMRLEEVRHEQWFGDRIRGHRLLRPATFFLGWSPPEPAGPQEDLVARPLSGGSGTTWSAGSV